VPASVQKSRQREEGHNRNAKSQQDDTEHAEKPQPTNLLVSAHQ
jgi:hypothetical protein